MGDRCYMTVTCRRADMGLFEELGFVPDDDSNSPVVEMTDEEANYGHANDLPTTVPFFAQHGAGGNYGPYLFACDGRELVEVPGSEHGFAIEWDYHEGEPTAKSVAAIRRYLALKQKVQRRFKRLRRTPAKT